MALCCHWLTASECCTVATAVPVLLAIAAAWLSYAYCTRHYGLWKRLGVPCTDPVPLFGHFADPMLGRRSSTEMIDALYRRFDGHRYFGLYQLLNPMLVARDPELVHALLTKEFASFHDRIPDSKQSFEHDPLFDSLANLGGVRWRAVRSKLNPTFTASKLKAMFGDMRACAEQLVDKLSSLTPGGQDVVNITDISSKFSTDTIGRCAFGLNCNSLFDADSEYCRAGQVVFRPTLRSSLFHFVRMIGFGRLLDLFRVRMMPDHVYEFFLSLFRGTMELRETEKENRNDFVSILIKMRNEERAKEGEHSDVFTDGVLASNAFIFFAAGFETTSSTISYCLYELALNQDIQTKLRNEIVQKLNTNDGKFTYDVVKDMKYLDMTLNETLRLHPPGPGLVRVCTKSYTIPESDITLDTGTHVFIPVYSLHNDAQYYPEPEIFDPQRFTEENKASRPNGTFLPFGDGPRICIGMRFAMMEAKTGLAKILSKFEVFPCKETQIPIELNPRAFLLTPNKPIFLLFKKL